MLHLFMLQTLTLRHLIGLIKLKGQKEKTWYICHGGEQELQIATGHAKRETE